MTYFCGGPGGSIGSVSKKRPEEFLRNIDQTYMLKVPMRKSECQGDEAYWFLMRRGNPVCKVFIPAEGMPYWEKNVNIDLRTDVYVEVIQKSQYCSRSVIDTYQHNKLYGEEDE